MESAITTKGQATIPKAIRVHLGLKPGDKIKFFMHPNGSVVILPRIPATAVKGTIKTVRRISIEEMNEVIASAAAITNSASPDIDDRT